MHGGDSLFGRMTTTAHVYSDSRVDPELDHKAYRVTEKLSESINTIANEPSVAFYRIQEHVRKTLPQLVEQKHEVEEVQQKVQGACFDTEYAGNAVKMMQKSVVHFQNIQELLKNAMFMKQQIDYEEARRPPGTGTRPEEAGTSKAEEGSSDMGDSAVSTDSSLVASGHANTEADDGDCTTEAREAEHSRASGENQEESCDSTQARLPTDSRGNVQSQADSEPQDLPGDTLPNDESKPGEPTTANVELQKEGLVGKGTISAEDTHVAENVHAVENTQLKEESKSDESSHITRDNLSEEDTQYQAI